MLPDSHHRKVEGTKKGTTLGPIAIGVTMFTDKSLKALRPRKNTYRVFEKSVDKGFCVQVTPAGGIYFYMQYQSPVTGRRRFLPLGRYPTVTLAKARDKLRAARSTLAAGKDPRITENSLKNRQPGTVEALCAAYTDDMRTKGKRSAGEVLKLLKKNVLPYIGDFQASKVEPFHIREILFEIINRGAPVASNRVRSYLHAAFTYGIHHDNDPKRMNSRVVFRIDRNPVADVPKDASVEGVGDRELSWQEIKALWEVTDEALGRPYKLALQLLLATCGQRPNEVISAPLSEFDLKARVWSIPPVRTKNKRWHLLPLTDMAIDLIDQVHALHGRKGLQLFPRYGDPDKPGHMSRNGLSRSVQRLCADTKFDKFVPRDLRRTVKTRMGELGIAKDVRDRLQNHAAMDVSAKHYDRYDYMAEKRAAAEQWCDFLEVTISGGNVVPIRKTGDG